MDSNELAGGEGLPSFPIEILLVVRRVNAVTQVDKGQL